ncbi:TetR/AcrR family transcriptional regulator [Xenorhabdus szentirmaii]|uniref:TetR/AcrR family transcriptional regulator n=1 Tax=Xenorhabdus szentirmaii TaxID=290112 RepID=UPI0019BDFAA8|nr:TetR/AcrR family transcriptional regulator [Xenorhabdus sp. 38]MBD2781428.1 TetR/AcrR family transcriptional regulator [Xenorhabdus sp. 38]
MKTYQRRPKHDPKESEQEILNAAEQFLIEHPFRALNVDEVMRRTGLKRPAFYVHFRDKYDLVLRVVQNIGQELFKIANRLLKGNNFQDDSLRAIEEVVEVYHKNGAFLRALAEAAGADERVEQVYYSLIQDFISETIKHIYKEQALGRISKDIEVEETARALIWLEERYLSEAFGRTPQADPKIVVKVLHNIWMSSLYR